jgi:PhnB protein
MSQTISPYLTVKGAANAIAFYQKAFDAKVNMQMPTEDKKRVMHADLTIHGGTVFLSDEFPEHGGPGAPSADKPVGVAVAVQLPGAGDVDAVFKQAVAAGANGTVEPADMFWGARFAMVTDPFGHRWMFNGPFQK